jgi:transketolase
MAIDPRLKTWKELGVQLRVDSIRSTTAAGSGHPTSSMSAADLMAVMLASHLRFDISRPRAAGNDRLIFSKGHASPLLYAILKAAGGISDEEMMTLRRRGSRIEGHPAPVLPFVEVATGSLGQGLAMAVGMALAAQRLDHIGNRFWVLLGDSELAEGSVYESFAAASFYGLSSVTAILDMNRLGQRGPTALGWNGEAYASRARAFGWEAVVVDGHNALAIDEAYSAAERALRPTLVVAKTKKGSGVSFLEDKEGWHGKALSREEAGRALAELGWSDQVPSALVKPARPTAVEPAVARTGAPLELPAYALGAKVATRAGFGDALVAVGSTDLRVLGLDGEVGNSTYMDRFAKAHPERFFEMFIAEQQMVSAAVGLQVFGWTPFAATFSAFLTRALDQIRMAAISGATLNLVGSHAGVSIGEDGPSQMGLEDLAMMRAVHGSVVLYPSCANATAMLVAEMAKLRGIQYLRTTREKTPVIYSPGERFPIGGSKILRRSDRDRIAIVGAGITVHEALKAHEELASRDLAARVIDLYSVKPVDRATLRAAARECASGLLVVEDHHPEGGLADAVSEAFEGVPAPAIRRLAVRIMPGSATAEQQRDGAGIDAHAIVEAVTAALAVNRGSTPEAP